MAQRSLLLRKKSELSSHCTQAWITNSWQASGGTVFATTDRGLKHRVGKLASRVKDPLNLYFFTFSPLLAGDQLLLCPLPFHGSEPGCERDQTWNPVHLHCQRHL